MLRLYTRLFKPTQTKLEHLTVQLNILSEYKKYLIPFLHSDPGITNTIGKAYLHLALSKLCFFSGPWLIKAGINTLMPPPNQTVALQGVVQQAVQTGLWDTIINHPVLFFLGYGLCYSGSVLFQSLRNVQISKISNRALQEMSARMFLHVLTLGPDFFFSGSQRKTLFNLTKALSAIQFNLRMFGQFFVPLFLDISISSALILHNFGPSFVSAFLLSFGFYSFFTVRYSDYRRKKVAEQREAERHSDFVVSETWANYYNIKYYSSEKYQAQRYINSLEKQRDIILVNQSSLGTLNSVQRMIFGMGLTSNMIFAAHYARQGLMSAGDVIMIQTLMLQLINPMFFLGTMYRTFTDNIIDIRELYRVLNTTPSVPQKKDAEVIEKVNGRIQFRNVSFKYSNQTSHITQNLNFTIQPNSFVVLMGPSGVGKSTLFNLIFRLYDPISGDILIDDKSLKDLTLASFRKHIMIVSQQAYLFNDTVMNNLMYSFEDPHNQKLKPQRYERIYQLCKELEIHDYIMSLPQGYDTPVGEKGSRFSGGEKQRLCLVRALLPDRKILLLDEPTSALDQGTEQKVLRMIAKKKSTTRVMISHRIHPNCRELIDNIIYLDKPSNS